MRLRNLAVWFGGLAGGLVLALIRLVALALSPLQIGRLLSVVSVPRLGEHRVRTSLTVAGVALGGAVLVAVVLINRSILGSVTATMNDIGGRADLQVSAGSTGFDEALCERVRAQPGVDKATPVVQQVVSVMGRGGARERLLLLGIDFLGADDARFRSYASDEVDAIKADPITFLNAPHSLILSRSVAQRLGYKLHDRISLKTPSGSEPFDIWGFIDNRGVGQAFGGSMAIMDYQAMQAIFLRKQNIDRVDVALRPGADRMVVMRSLQQALGPGFSVEPPARKNERTAMMLHGIDGALTLTSVIAVLVAMFLIYETMTIGVVQRQRELGVLRALGTTRRQLLGLLTLEGLLLGITGAAIGVGFGVLLAGALLEGMKQTVGEVFVETAQAAGLRVDPAVLAGGFLATALAGALAAAIPARRAGRAQVVQVLRGVAAAPAAPAARRVARGDLLAAALLALATLIVSFPAARSAQAFLYLALLALIGAGVLLVPRLVQAIHRMLRTLLVRTGWVELRLANENLPRNLLHTWMTVAALMVGVAMASGVSALVGSFIASAVEWIEQSVPADLWVSSGGMPGTPQSTLMAPTLRAELAQVPGVAEVERLRVDDLTFRGAPIKLATVETEIYTRRATLMMLEGTPEQAARGLARGALLVSENLSRLFGVHKGDRIPLSTGAGTHWFEVAGVNVDYTSDRGTILIDRATSLRHWADDRVGGYKIHLHDPTQAERVRRVLVERYSESHDLMILTNREVKGRIMAVLNQTFGAMRALELVAIVIAVLGVVNGLLAGVLDRVRELGLLRALGTLRGQLRRMVVAEGLLIGGAGVAAGTLLGALLGRFLLYYANVAQTGWYFPYHAPYVTLLEVGAVVLVASALAAWYPARHAAALKIVDALDHE